MLEITKNLRPNSLISTYPNYHTGDYFEEYFYKRFMEEYPSGMINDLTYIPIFWTNCYGNVIHYYRYKAYDIQSAINSMDDSKRYFTVSQHDDCIYETLPFDCIIFSMGGNKVDKNIIPIPLICSPIKSINNKKTIQVSFMGSLTHPIRNKLFDTYKNDNMFVFAVKEEWQLDVGASNVEHFIDITSKSLFTLAPRGSGKTSFRMYESMQLNSIPIYVYDVAWLPWEDEIDWNDIALLCNENEIFQIKDKIKNTNYIKMIKNKYKLYENYFTFEGVYNNIIKRLVNGSCIWR